MTWDDRTNTTSSGSDWDTTSSGWVIVSESEHGRLRAERDALLEAAKLAVAGELSPSGDAYPLLVQAIQKAEGRA